MSLLATLYPERFVRPVGIAKIYGMADDYTIPSQAVSKTEEMKSIVLQAVINGCETDDKIADLMNRSRNCVRTYLLNLISERKIKKIEIKSRGKGCGAFKHHYFPIDKEVDIEEIIKNIPDRPGYNPVHGRNMNEYYARTAYADALKSGKWTNTHTVADKVGRSRNAAYKTLNAMFNAGLIERRTLGNHAQNGFEWRKK